MMHLYRRLIIFVSATAFAKQLGFKEEDLHSDESINLYKQWKLKNCQPNYWKVMYFRKKKCD
jgi:N4-(beta-N-acetylglucosaminyl)-L-asparaginase